MDRGRGGGDRRRRRARSCRPGGRRGRRPLTIFAIGSIVVLTLVNLHWRALGGLRPGGRHPDQDRAAAAGGAAGRWRLGGGQPLEPLARVPLTLGGIVARGGADAVRLHRVRIRRASAPMSPTMPQEAVPGATVNGTVFVALIYLAATLRSPVAAAERDRGQSRRALRRRIAPTLGAIAGGLVAVIAAISALGTGNALILLSVEVGGDRQCRRSSAGCSRRTNRNGVADRLAARRRGGRILLVLASISDSFVAGLYLHRAGFGGRRRWCSTSSAPPPRSSSRPTVRARGDRASALVYRRGDVRRRRAGSDPVGLWRWSLIGLPIRWLSPALNARGPARRRRRSSLASGISRRSFCAKLRRHTSLVPSGPAT